MGILYAITVYPCSTKSELNKPWNPYYGHRQKDFAAECRRISQHLRYRTPFKNRAEREAFRDDVMLLTHALWCWLSQAEPLGIPGQDEPDFRSAKEKSE